MTLPLQTLGRVVLAGMLLAPVAEAQSTVSGAVYDSIARKPLQGATVQLAAADNAVHFTAATISDSLGHFIIAGVPQGRFLIGFQHPVQDSVGIEPMLREVRVAGTAPVVANLSIPSPASLQAAVCGSRATADANALLMGAVIDARDQAPIAGATITGEWVEMSFTRGNVARHIARISATTKDNGLFALCNVPGGGTMFVSASRGADSSDRIELQVPATGFLRRELYLGAHGATSHGAVSGTVRAAIGGLPLTGALVSIGDSARALTNERGEWTLANAPLGTRMLDVRAVGYYPEHRGIDVIAGAPPVRIQLATLKAVLDTIRVTASRFETSGFEDRRKTGMGKFLTPKDIAARGPTTISDLFRSIPGVKMDNPRGSVGGKIMMRGNFDAECSPAMYLDGHYMGGINIPGFSASTLTADDVDFWATPDKLAGVEVYPQGTVPAQFQQGLADCGSIVIWTKR